MGMGQSLTPGPQIGWSIFSLHMSSPSIFRGTLFVTQTSGARRRPKGHCLLGCLGNMGGILHGILGYKPQ